MATPGPTVARVIERYASMLRQAGITPERVILFGSHAKGSPREDSDIDLVIISKDFARLDLRERAELLGLAATRMLEPIEALGYTPDEANEHPFVRSLLEEESSVSILVED